MLQCTMRFGIVDTIARSIVYTAFEQKRNTLNGIVSVIKEIRYSFKTDLLQIRQFFFSVHKIL